MPKIPGSSPEDRQSRRHNPLAEEYSPSAPVKQKAGKKRKSVDVKEDELDFVGSKASRRILQQGQELVDEEEAELSRDNPNPAFALESRLVRDAQEQEQHVYGDEDDAWGDEDEKVEEVEVDLNDQDIFNRFHPTTDQDLSKMFDTLSGKKPPETGEEEGGAGGTNLADLILEKIAAHEAAGAGGEAGDRAQSPTSAFEDEPPTLSPKVVEVYTTVGQLLSRHRSGPLPKPFKILPTLPANQIPELIALTDPDGWSPHAVFMATRLFISGKPAVTQPFLTSILLPRVRDEIHETKKLHVHLYNAIKKSLYKPAAFFKGFLFPLLEDGDCTLKEAEIVSSVLKRVSIPVLHSAAALLRLCDIGASQFTTRMEEGGGGATNVFIRTLLEKKYALPFKVVDALVFHFMRFKALETARDDKMDDVEMSGTGSKNNRSNPQGDKSKLPVLWHQALLAFAQRYRNDITEDQREALLDLLIGVGHRTIGPEIRRELLAGRGRGVVAPEEGPGDGGDDTMVMN